jgi:hypothetical protein
MASQVGLFDGALRARIERVEREGVFGHLDHAVDEVLGAAPELLSGE